MARMKTGTPDATGMRLPSMGAQFTVGPASRNYRTVLIDGKGTGSAVTPSQMTEDESDGGMYDDAEMSADSDGDYGDDAGELTDFGDEGDESNDATSDNEGTDRGAE